MGNKDDITDLKCERPGVLIGIFGWCYILPFTAPGIPIPLGRPKGSTNQQGFDLKKSPLKPLGSAPTTSRYSNSNDNKRYIYIYNVIVIIAITMLFEP